MLQSIRDRLTGPLVWFVVGLIVIPFAFWGIESFRMDGGDPTVAKVGGDEITQSQLRRNYEQRFQQLQSLMGDNFRPELFDERRFRQTVLNDMLQEAALRKFALEQGYHTADAALFDYISQIPAFQLEGQFSADTYRDALARQGMRADQFEAQLRDALVIDQLRGSVLETAFVTQTLTAEAYRLQEQKREVKVVAFDPDDFRQDIEISDEQIADRYESEKSRWTAPERIKVNYVELDVNQLPAAEAPGDDVLELLYEAEKNGRFSTPEERKARHILIGFGADKSAAHEKAQELRKQLDDGGDFGTLAKANSEDPGSKDAGGDLGWVRRGTMVPKFEDTLFDMKAQQISDPIETEFGWHIIGLDEIKPAAQRKFSEEGVKAELLALYQARERQEHFSELSTQLEQLAFEKSTLAPVAEALQLELKTSDWFGRAGGVGIAAEPTVAQAAFSPEVLDNEQNSRPLGLADGRLVVIHKADYTPSRQKTLEEVSDGLRKELIDEAAAKRALAAAETLLSAVGGEVEKLEELAGEQGGKLRFEGKLGRRDATVDAQVLQAVFALPHPQDAKPLLKTLSLNDGRASLIALTGIETPTDAEAAGAVTHRNQLRDAVAGAEMDAYRAAIADEVEVRVLQSASADDQVTDPESL
ncbi:MAG: SurA N-terminal domain-containing protein [Panacagrimonas sp.]